MTTIPIGELFLITYCLVGDWYRQRGSESVIRIAGAKPDFSDSEVLTLMLSIDFFEFASERRCISFIRANYSDLFPTLPDQSQSDRRSRDICYLSEELRRDWSEVLGVLRKIIFCLIPRLSYR